MQKLSKGEETVCRMQGGGKLRWIQRIFYGKRCEHGDCTKGTVGLWADEQNRSFELCAEHAAELGEPMVDGIVYAPTNR